MAFVPPRSGPACTTTYQVPLAGGYTAPGIKVVTSALPCASAMTCLRAMAIFPRCVQLPMWMCEMCDESACSPWTTTSTVTLGGAAVVVTFNVPAAVVLIPLSLKLKPLGVGDGVGLGLATGDAEVEDDPVPPAEPHDAAIAATAAIANHLFKTAESPQVCPWRYSSRLLDGPRPLTRLDLLGPTPPRPAGAPPDQVTKAEKDQHRTDRA